MIEKKIERIIFASRWLLAPFYLGLVATLLVLLVKFFFKFADMLFSIWSMEGTALVLPILGLVDLVLVSNLLILIIFSGYENFVSKIEEAKEHTDRPEWMGNIDYGSLKIKVIGSIVAISSIDLLKAFFAIEHYNKENLMWLVIVHLTFVVSGVLFAIMERISHPAHPVSAVNQEH
ncbi:TIGR00645 family protein [Beggiatoa leptomitoformis]|uniref:UPF0114 protein BLE401_02290 n=1 Tax=Beggiatoa leptomitoformis TaxID=288004 RepID=A0A2N9YJ80_9GAMM|nr:TIGR00645 family protein [Beggiatoa leptomitoformis]ALG69313.1 TIGR00645 family protein [Beggiatoa leptomitoformis]AUI70499.1 TIGR00645 family protein [Beggiatoa leptomitoformis]